MFLFRAFKRAKQARHETGASRDVFDFVAKWGQDIAGGITLFSCVFLALVVVMAVTGDTQGIPVMICIYMILLFIFSWGMSYLNKCPLRLGAKLSYYYFRHKRTAKNNHQF